MGRFECEGDIAGVPVQGHSKYGRPPSTRSEGGDELCSRRPFRGRRIGKFLKIERIAQQRSDPLIRRQRGGGDAGDVYL